LRRIGVTGIASRPGPGADTVGIVARVGKQRSRRGQVVATDEVEAPLIGGLARRHVAPHRKAPSAEVHPGRLGEVER
jgi:hypothetical protein